MKEKIEEAARDYATCEVGCGGLKGVRGIDGSKVEPFIAGAEWMQKQSFGCSDAKNLNLALSALKNISDPISYLESEAKRDGSIIDGRAAIEFANNGVSISNMAKDALYKIKSIPLSIKSPWISVRDWLPEDGELALVLIYGELYVIYFFDKVSRDYYSGQECNNQFTCWMPIPELPKGGEG